eukprot:TRINITY_DN11645_c0_g1_i1.p1 TRINITY_DN11645_c0_g1~~TRINITY_DN11645_c0_g1_i1.p1  ORF type:complete len:510 (-),score=113.97 TRINITY_DN11645_c0_g1_i1:23-1327(-)
MRLEHHAQHRVAWAGWWLKKTTAKATACDGYARSVPAVLALQSTAAKGWMIAAAHAFIDSGWARGLHASGLAAVKLMGFESNNPLHDDHEGKGAHWHPTVRHIAGAGAKRVCRFAARVNPTPHLYLATDGTIDVSGVRLAQQAAGEHGALGIERLECFGTFLTRSGGLQMCPLVALHSAREGAGCLHVRAGWVQHGRGRELQLIGAAGAAGVEDIGSLWGLEMLSGWRDENGRQERDVALRSTRCGRYLHVRQSAQELQAQGPDWKWRVLMMHESSGSGSVWVLERDGVDTCHLRSRRTDEYLHVRKGFAELKKRGLKEQVFQLSADRGSAGSRWRLRAAREYLLSPQCSIIEHSYSMHLRAGAAQDSCCVDVQRDGSAWASVSVKLNSDHGLLTVRTEMENEPESGGTALRAGEDEVVSALLEPRTKEARLFF